MEGEEWFIQKEITTRAPLCENVHHRINLFENHSPKSSPYPHKMRNGSSEKQLGLTLPLLSSTQLLNTRQYFNRK